MFATRVFLCFLCLATGCALSSSETTAKYDNNTLVYTHALHTEEATQLGEYLQSNGFFKSDTSHKLRLDKQGQAYVLCMAVSQRHLENEAFIDAVKSIRGELSAQVFSGAALTLQLCNETFDVQMVVP